MRKRESSTWGVPALFLALMTQLSAQPPSFEVASVKRANGVGGVRGSCHGIDTKYPPQLIASAPPLGRCLIADASLDQMLAIAYRFRFMESIKGGPGWAQDGVRFNLEAKAEDPTKATEAQLCQMLQALLIDRFKIKLHTEIHDVPGFALVVSKNGPKLQEADAEETASFKVISGRPMTLTARKYSMRTFAVFLELRMANGPVVDKTGLTAAYDFNLSWDEQDGPALVTVVRELGLRLEPQKLPAPFLVIESAEMPTEN